VSVGIFFLLILASLILVPTAYGALRDEINVLQDRVKDIYEDIRKLEIEVQKEKNNVDAYEVALSNAQTRQKHAANNYSENPTDDTKKLLNDANNEVAKAKREFANSEAKLNSLENSLREKNNQVIGLEKEIIEKRLLPEQSFREKTDHEHYGITLGKTCVTMLQNNLDTNCPTYEELNALFPDTSYQAVSGQLEYIDGMYQRDTETKRGHWGFYRFHETSTIWIDPPGDIRDKINLIIIEPRLPEYKISGVSHIMSNNTITLGHDRYIDNCKTATLSATNWVFLVGDTMRYLQNNCDPKFTTFDHIKTKIFEKTEMDISTSYKWQLDNWIAQVKQDCKTLCKEY
jgi:hypothetical protein